MSADQSPVQPSLVDEPQFDFSNTRHWQTWGPPREKLFLKMLGTFRDRQVRFLEIGSFEGASAIWMLRNVLTHPESRLTCIDNDKLGCGKRLVANLAASGFQSRAVIHWIDSHAVRQVVPDDHFDFVYVDGSHAAPNVLFDVVNAYLICKPGGLVGCDDYLFELPENGSVPKPAIDAFLKLMGDRVEVVHSGYQLWFRKRAERPASA
jgi:predicted O-methyltransferase YrrM